MIQILWRIKNIVSTVSIDRIRSQGLPISTGHWTDEQQRNKNSPFQGNRIGHDPPARLLRPRTTD